MIVNITEQYCYLMERGAGQDLDYANQAQLELGELVLNRHLAKSSRPLAS